MIKQNDQGQVPVQQERDEETALFANNKKPHEHSTIQTDRQTDRDTKRDKWTSRLLQRKQAASKKTGRHIHLFTRELMDNKSFAKSLPP